jgi:hypothetical protein
VVINKQMTQLAATVKEVITTEQLHGLCKLVPGQAEIHLGGEAYVVGPQVQLTTPGAVGLGSDAMLGWALTAEERIARVLGDAIVEAEVRSLQTVSIDALIAELKNRADLFFMVMTSNTPEPWDWRRAVKGANYPLVGFVTMSVQGMVTGLAINSGSLTLLDSDIVDTDDADEEWKTARESPDDDLPPPSDE